MENQGSKPGNKMKDIQQETDQEANGKPGTSYAEDTKKNIDSAAEESPNIGTLENSEQSGSEENNDKESSLDADERSGGSVL
jgi:hypothetical protein